MMYQRDMLVLTCSVQMAPGLAEEAQQLVDECREKGVGAGEEEGEDQGHDDDHDRGRHRFLARRPVDAGGLDADLPDEFAGGDSCHCSVSLLRIEKGSADPSGRRSLRSLS